ncbi:S-adenosyl-L-methionine-dependent methyltransferase [Ustulina deusta]|nr:S-adenosyl-L-methionine-dependent methyltransferase [Ustulina deusta]
MSRSLVSTTESWDESASALLKTAFEGPTITLNKVLLERLNTISPFTPATAILDTGCGVAQVLGSLLGTYGTSLPADTRLVATDLSPGMVSIVDGRRATEISAGNTTWGRVETAVWDAQNLAAADAPDDIFSHITAGLVFFMVERPQDVLAETRRVLCDGGLFGMTSFRSAGWMDLIEEALDAVKPGSRLSPIPTAWSSTESIARQLEDAGFHDVTADEVKMVTANFSAEEEETAIQWMLKWLTERFLNGGGMLEGIAIVATGTK